MNERIGQRATIIAVLFLFFSLHFNSHYQDHHSSSDFTTIIEIPPHFQPSLCHIHATSDYYSDNKCQGRGHQLDGNYCETSSNGSSTQFYDYQFLLVRFSTIPSVVGNYIFHFENTLVCFVHPTDYVFNMAIVSFFFYFYSLSC